VGKNSSEVCSLSAQQISDTQHVVNPIDKQAAMLFRSFGGTQFVEEVFKVVIAHTIVGLPIFETRHSK